MPDNIEIPAVNVTLPTPSPTPPIASVEKHRMGRPIPTVVEPPKEILDMEFKMDDSLNNPDRTLQRIEEPVVVNTNGTQDTELKKGLVEEKLKVEQKVEDKKVEVKKEEKVEQKPKSPLDVLKMPAKKEGEKVEEVKAPVEKHEARDYSIFDQEEQTAAKQMSNIAFEQFKKLKVASKGSDAVFYQHPDAYTTHPDYKQSMNQIQQGEDEYGFWQQQLLNCKANKPVKNLIGYNKTTGEPTFGEDVTASPIVEEQIRQLMYKQQQNVEKARGNVQALQGHYKQEYTTLRSNFDAERSKRFAWAQNPELLNATIDMVADDGTKVTKSVQQIKNDFKSLFPPYLVNDMGVEVASDLMAAIVMQKAFHATQTVQESVKKAVENEEKFVEPSSSTKPSAKGDAFGGVTEFSAQGMPSKY